jgi:hypothetical protein
MTRHFLVHRFCAAVVRKFALAGCLAACLLGRVYLASAQQFNIMTFDVPGAGTSPFQGTFAIDIAPTGEIAGEFVDANNVQHGFLRTPDGSFTKFDPPGSEQVTIVRALNPKGVIVGGYLTTTTNTFHAFLRARDGRFTTWAAPGACDFSINDGCHGTGAWDINISGTIVGAYEDTSGNFVAHTYIRTPNGSFTSFEVPGSSMLIGQGTLPGTPGGLNDVGAITGLYYDANYNFHGYLRKRDGTFVKFEAPGADTSDPSYGTFPQGLNDVEAIEGYYLDASGIFHGFLRSRGGQFTSFDAPGADLTPGDFNGTFPSTINLFGVITGSYADASSASHGFVRYPDGTFGTFDAPGAGTGAFQGTTPYSNNLFGAITGYYIDNDNVAHGFVATPCDNSCEGNDQATVAVARVSPAPALQSPTTAGQVNPTLLRLGDRLMPWYRFHAAQPKR